jgi:hypothetical protein
MTDDTRRAIGKLVSVSSDRFVVEMHAHTDNFTVVGFDDFHYVARIGSFVVIPVQSDYVVAEVTGLREKDISPARAGPGSLERASSAKYLDVVPLGMLPKDLSEEFRFGVSTFPSLFADALYILDAELDRIFDTVAPSQIVEGESPNTSYKALTIGSSVVFDGYPVKVLVDEFFGGHVAVLGNTGSGKSCTASSILQSLFRKEDEYKARGATFMVFDVNGEYAAALTSLVFAGVGVKQLKIDGTANAGSFRLPHWFLDLSEWELLLRASERAQVPILRAALDLTAVISNSDEETRKIRKHVLAKCIMAAFSSQSDGSVAKRQRIVALLRQHGCDELTTQLLKKYGYQEQYGNFGNNQTNEDKFLSEVSSHIVEDMAFPTYANGPFSFSALEECFELALLQEEANGNKQIRDYCSQMITRFQSLRRRADYDFMRHEIDSLAETLSEEVFLRNVLGLKMEEGHSFKDSQIIILDMNDIEDEIVELVAAVLSRMIFKLLRRAEPRNAFPVHCLLEEAHRYIAEIPAAHAIDAGAIFERIAKEGRKYGLFLFVASQRPAELSKAVLSQCSNFVVHRIQNPDDLSQIRQMTPFISEAVLRRLPSLPKQHALVFGNAVKLPTTFKVREASPRPHSEDSRIRRLWFHAARKPASIRLS